MNSICYYRRAIQVRRRFVRKYLPKSYERLRTLVISLSAHIAAVTGSNRVLLHFFGTCSRELCRYIWGSSSLQSVFSVRTEHDIILSAKFDLMIKPLSYVLGIWGAAAVLFFISVSFHDSSKFIILHKLSCTSSDDILLV